MDSENTANRRYCRKCLLADYDEGAYIRDLKGVIDRMDKAMQAGPELYGKRLDICRGCDYLNRGTCDACGCYVELRAAVKKQKCPYKKW